MSQTISINASISDAEPKSIDESTFPFSGAGVARLPPPQESIGSPGSQVHSGHPQLHHAPVATTWPAIAIVQYGVLLAMFLLSVEKAIGKSNMQSTENTSLAFMKLSFGGSAKKREALSREGLYQRFSNALAGRFSSQSYILGFANQLIGFIETADSRRDANITRRLSEFLLSLPLPSSYQAVGNYYKGLSEYQESNFTDALSRFDNLMVDAPARYKAKALLSTGAVYFHRRDYQSFLKLSLEANHAAFCDNLCDPKTIIGSQRNIALYQSLEGDHQGAYKRLKEILPIVCVVAKSQPYMYYQHLNSLSVELCELNRFEEASQISRFVLASPYSKVYPEWRATNDEISLRGRRASRSLIAVPVSLVVPDNVVPMHLGRHDRVAGESTTRGPARIRSYEEWKTSMAKGQKKQNQAPQKTNKELVREMLELMTKTKLSRDQIERIITIVQEKKPLPTD